MPTYLEQTGAEVQEILNRPEIKRNSQLINDEGYINREEDPTVPSWSKQPNKPTYTAEEVGAMPSDAAFKTINGESVKGSGNINTEALELAGAPFDWALGISADDFLEYFGHSATKLLARGIAHYDETNSEYLDHYFLVSGQYPDEQDSFGTIVFDDGNSAYQFTITRLYDDEEATEWDKIENLKIYPSHLQPQTNLNSGSATEVPSVNAVKNRIEPIEAKIPAEASSSNKLADKAYVDGKVAVVDEKVGDIEDIIPDQASESNKLADKAFVNSTVQTGTANFRGTWPSVSAIPTNVNYYPEDYAGGHKPTVNDYLVVVEIVPSELQWEANRNYVIGQVVFDDSGDYPTYYHCIQAVASNIIPDEDTEHWEVWFYADAWDGGGITGTWRFKYTGNWDTNGKFGWQPEYQVNETPLTAAQLAALNSGITSSKVTKLDALPTNATLQQSLEDLTPLVLTYGTSYGEDTYNALEAIATGRINRKAFIKQGNNIYPASVEDYGAVYAVQAVELNEPDLSGAYKLSCVIAPDGADGYDTDWTRENAETQEVFWATYGTTTAEVIMAAYNAGKICACAYSNKVYLLTTFNASSITFSLTDSKNYRVLSVDRTTDAWQNYLGVLFEDSSNRKSTITGNETSTTYYPNTKAVADYVQTAIFGAMSNSY